MNLQAKNPLKWETAEKKYKFFYKQKKTFTWAKSIHSFMFCSNLMRILPERIHTAIAVI